MAEEYVAAQAGQDARMSTWLSAGISLAYLEAQVHLATEDVAFVLALKSDDEPGTIERELSGTLESRQAARLMPDDGLAGMQTALAANCATDQETLTRVVDALRAGLAEPLPLLPSEQMPGAGQNADKPRN